MVRVESMQSGSFPVGTGSFSLGSRQKAAISSKVIETASAQISFFEAGTESNLPALVLLPGLFCSAHRFITAMLPLAEKTRVVAVDWRGHGSSVASRGFTVKDCAEDVMAVIRTRLKGSKVCILGHSMGARVIWSMLESYRNELSPILEGVAIIDQSPVASTGKSSSGPGDAQHASTKRDSQLISMGRKQMIETLKRLWADGDSGFMHNQTELREFLKFAADCNHVAGAGLHWDALSTDYSHIVQQMNTKALLIVGDSTLGASGIYERMGAAIPRNGAHFALIKGGTHCPHLQPEHVPELTRLVHQLLNGSLQVNATQQTGCRPQQTVAKQQMTARGPSSTPRGPSAPMSFVPAPCSTPRGPSAPIFLGQQKQNGMQKQYPMAQVVPVSMQSNGYRTLPPAHRRFMGA